MKILFVALADSFTPGMMYQDNCFCDVLLNEGHQVTIISNPEAFVNGKLEKVKPGTSVVDGLKLVRIQRKHIINSFITEKIRAFDSIFHILEEEKPEIIYCHGVTYLSLLEVVRYKKSHDATLVYADTHGTFFNSGRNWLSRNILHKVYYKLIYKQIEPYLKAFFYVGAEEKEFALKVYNANQEIMKFLPLGGYVLDDIKYNFYRNSIRKKLQLNEKTVLLIHSGKMDNKKNTYELLDAFSHIKELNVRLLLIGSIPENMQDKLVAFIKRDDRIKFIGWKDSKELIEYLCACDLYCQPGSVSSTFQTAICCRCPIIAYPHISYTENYNFGSVLWAKNSEEIENHILDIIQNRDKLNNMTLISKRIGEEILDYHRIVSCFVPHS